MTDSPATDTSGPFRLGDRVQLPGEGPPPHHHSARGRRAAHPPRSPQAHDRSLIGQPDGSVVANSGGHEYLALPAAAGLRHVDAARRGHRVPEGCRPDPRPGRRLPRRHRRGGRSRLGRAVAVAPRGRSATEGRLVSFERRADFADVARANVETFLGRRPPRTRTWSSATWPRRFPTPWPRASVDRVVLDMLAPWECIDVGSRGAHARRGASSRYVATATQLSRVAEFIRGDRAVHRARGERDHGARLACRGTRRAA